MVKRIIFHFCLILTSVCLMSAQQTEKASLRLYSAITTGTSSLEVGKEYVISTRVQNMGSSAWTGTLWLKVDGNTIAYESYTIPANKNKAYRIRGRWTPPSSGSYKVELFYQTNTKGSGRLVNFGNFSNPQYLTVKGGEEKKARLFLSSKPVFGTNPIEVGKSTRYVASVMNDGNKAWSGVFFLKSEGQDVYHWETTIQPGSRRNLVFDYTPSEVGTKEYTLWSQEGGRGRGQLVDGNGYSNAVRLTVNAPYKGKVSLAGTMGFGGTTTLEKGKTYRFTAKIIADKDWSGAFYLKNGEEDVHSWYVSLRQNTIQTITFDYTPQREGTQVLILYAQEGGSGAGVVVDRNGYSNPIRITVKGGEEKKARLFLSSKPVFGTNPIEVGKSTRYVASVMNDGNKAWSGVFFLKSEGQDVYHWETTIQPGSRRNLVFDYTPSEVGTKEYTLWSQEGGRGRGQLVDGNGYSNAVRLTVNAPYKGKVSLAGTMGFGGTTTLEKGKTYRFTAKIIADKDWSGAFYLKNGEEDVHSWYVSLRQNTIQTITFDYTPQREGTQVLILYAQEGGSGAGVVVDRNGYSNPIRITVKGGEEKKARLFLSSKPVFGTNPIEVGKSTRYVASVMNDGNKAWSGVFFLKSEGQDVYHWETTIQPGSRRNLVFDYTPSEVGTKEYTLWSQEGGRGRGQLVDGNGYSNAVRLTVNAPYKGKVSLAGTMGFGGTTTLEKGKTYRFTAKIIADKDWSGAFYLKNGEEDVHSWYVSLRQNTIQTITFDYTPQREGTQVLILYAQEGGSGAGVVVDRNGYSNPIRITVKGASTRANLQMQSAIRVYSKGETILNGSKATVKVSLYNKGKTAYSGEVCLKNPKNNNVLLYFEPKPTKIPSQGARQLEGEFLARTSGRFEYGLYYKEGDKWIPVQGNGSLAPTIVFTVEDAPSGGQHTLKGLSHPTLEKGGVPVSDAVNVGTVYTVVCPVKNEGKSSFSGEIALRRVKDKKLFRATYVSQIKPQQSEKISVTFVPTEDDCDNTGATRYELCSKLSSGKWESISGTDFSVNVVRDNEQGNYRLGVKVKKLTPDINELVPKQGGDKTVLFYTFRLVDAKERPVSGLKLKAVVLKDYSGGGGGGSLWSANLVADTTLYSETNEKETGELGVAKELLSTSSDNDGYVTLALPFASHIPDFDTEYVCRFAGVQAPDGNAAKVVESQFKEPFGVRKARNPIPLKSLEFGLKEKNGHGLLGIKPKFRVSLERENGRWVNPYYAIGVEGGLSLKFPKKTKDNSKMKKATNAFYGGAEGEFSVGFEGEVGMNQDLMIDAPLFLIEVVCRLSAQMLNSIGGRWSNGAASNLENYADALEGERDKLEDSASDVSAGFNAKVEIGGHVGYNRWKKGMERNDAPMFNLEGSLKGSAEYKFNNKFHNSSVPSQNTQTIAHQLKAQVEGELAFGLKKSEIREILKTSYGWELGGDLSSVLGWVWNNKYEKVYGNQNFFAPELRSLSCKSTIGPLYKAKLSLDFFSCRKNNKLFSIEGGITASFENKYSNKGTIGGGLLSYMNTLSYSKQTPLSTGNLITLKHNPLDPNQIGEFMLREYDPKKAISYLQSSPSDIKEDYTFQRDGSLDIDLNLSAKEFKIAGISLIDSKKEVKLPFSINVNYPPFSHSYYYAAGNRMITTDSIAFAPDANKALTLIKDQVRDTYDQMMDAMAEGIVKATKWAVDKGLAFFSTAGDKTVEFVNSVRDYLGSLFRSSELRANPQQDISHIRFVIPGEGQVFDNGTNFDFSYAYPAGEATGICKQDGDEFVIISDIFYMRAQYNGMPLLNAPNGDFTILPEVGADDLATLSLHPDSPVMLYYLPMRAENNEWQRVGEAKGTHKCSGLGNYALGVSLSQDNEPPMITCYPDRPENRLLVEVEDNIGIRWSSLSIIVNGTPRTFHKTSKHTQVTVPLAEGELAEGKIPNIFITVEDLAHNKGSYEQYDPNAVATVAPRADSALPVCYPNPADTYVNVRIAPDWMGASYALYSTEGHLLGQGTLSEQTQRIDLPQDDGDILFLRILISDKTYTQAIIRKL